jgi:hypothetical protein
MFRVSSRKMIGKEVHADANLLDRILILAASL